MARPRGRRSRPGGQALVVGLLLICVLGVAALLRGSHTPDRRASSARMRPTPLSTSLPVVAPGTAFAPGACLAYRPLHGDRHRTVFVDAGHGGPDPGATGTTSAGATVLEKDGTLAMARALLPLLRAQGYRVVLSRAGDTAVARLSPDDIANGALTVAGEHRATVARIACANAARADVLLALHLDAFDDPTVGGAETLYDSARPFRAANQRLATLVQQHVLASLRAAGWAVDDRGALDDLAGGTPALTSEAAAYGHLLELGPAAPGWLAQPSAMPGVLCEPLFLTDPAEADIATRGAGQQAIAQGLARAIDAFFAPPAVGGRAQAHR